MSQDKNFYRSKNGGVQTLNNQQPTDTQYDTIVRNAERHTDQVGILHAGVIRSAKNTQAA